MPNNLQRSPTELNRERQIFKIISHQHDVSRFQRSCRACAAHRDTDGGQGQRRSIVDSVADHRHLAVLCQEFLDCGKLVLRKQFRSDFIQPNLRCNCLRGLLIIAGQHDHVLNPGFF